MRKYLYIAYGVAHVFLLVFFIAEKAHAETVESIVWNTPSSGAWSSFNTGSSGFNSPVDGVFIRSVLYLRNIPQTPLPEPFRGRLFDITNLIELDCYTPYDTASGLGIPEDGTAVPVTMIWVGTECELSPTIQYAFSAGSNDIGMDLDAGSNVAGIIYALVDVPDAPISYRFATGTEIAQDVANGTKGTFPPLVPLFAFAGVPVAFLIGRKVISLIFYAT